jgi:dipeptide transport system ATP-binding protein
MSPAPLLSVRDLRVGFATEGGLLQAVDGVSFDVRPGEVLAIVGESGSGKSVTAQTMIGLTRSKNSRIEGSVKLEGEELLDADDATMRRLRGEKIGMVFQDPMTSFNPVYRLGAQIVEAIRAHQEDVGKEQARQRVVELFEQVGIPDAERRIDSYPHEFSGGMRQRAMIAMALALEPEVLIADEPTTALDVTIQAQILDLLLSLQRERGMALVLITHNMGVVAETAQRVMVMYAGQIMEERDAASLFDAPQHPYTAALLAALPERSVGDHRLATIPGVVPGLFDRPRGCLFSPRCRYATEHSREIRPELRPWKGGHIRCHYPLGDPDRDREIAADRPVGAEAVT